MSSDNSSFESDSECEDRVNGPTECRTENGALSLASAGDGRVHLFYKTIRGLDQTLLDQYLTESWNEDPSDTLKMIFFIRDIRGKGKGEKKLFHQSFQWLINNHPECVRHTAKHIPFYGSYKDWLEIFLGTKYEKSMLKSFAKQLRKDCALIGATFDKKENTNGKQKQQKRGFFSYLWGTPAPSPSTPLVTPMVATSEVSDDTKENHISISLAWKWAPTENTHYDKGKYKGTVAKLCKYLKLSKRDYRKTATLMRAHLGVVEAFMCKKEWDQIDFSKVPSRAMNIYKKAYAKHQALRFTTFLEGVKTGEVKMNTGTLQPHEIVGQYIHTTNPPGERSDVEAQWQSFLKGLKDKGVSFDDTISVVDTSQSMTSCDGMPRKVAYSLGLLVSQLCTGAFANKWIEFSTQAKIHQFPEGSLYNKLKSIKEIVESTNIQAVFDTILNIYATFSVPREKQIKRIFIFTDGQWNQMTTNSSLTNYQAIQRKFEKLGYDLPTMIFWNLRAGTVDFPVSSDTPGTVLISGFSSDLLRLFLDGGDVNPLGIVLKAVRDSRYDQITL